MNENQKTLKIDIYQSLFMFFQLLLTNECNLKCKYCYAEAFEDFSDDFENTELDYGLPKEVSYNLQSLSDFCKKDSECILTFYGGEPLLKPNLIKAIMDKVPAKHFIIQTNGIVLNNLGSEHLKKFHTILVSIDGDKSTTDYYRGAGTYKKIINNLKMLNKIGFSGEIIARMTVMEQTNIYNQIKWLLNNEDFSFSSIHWQLNAGFWSNDYLKRNFKDWSLNNYIPNLEKLIQFWIKTMKKGTVLKLYPLLGVANSLLLKKDSLLRCGGGWINYAIQTDGYIIPCPTMWGMKSYYLGHISSTEPSKIPQISINNMPCSECSILNVCGGRCLYANITQRWKKDDYSNVCNTVKYLINSISQKLPTIQNLIFKKTINYSDFEFLAYNGCEIIP